MNYSNTRLIFLLSIALLLFPVLARTAECRVNDTSTGYWILWNKERKCLFPGERSPESPWPNAENWNVGPYRIDGFYKQNSRMGSTGWSLTPK